MNATPAGPDSAFATNRTYAVATGNEIAVLRRHTNRVNSATWDAPLGTPHDWSSCPRSYLLGGGLQWSESLAVSHAPIGTPLEELNSILNQSVVGYLNGVPTSAPKYSSQAVIVGDPQQLPPTDFFAVTSDGDGQGGPEETILELGRRCWHPMRMLEVPRDPGDRAFPCPR